MRVRLKSGRETGPSEGENQAKDRQYSGPGEEQSQAVVRTKIRVQ